MEKQQQEYETTAHHQHTILQHQQRKKSRSQPRLGYVDTDDEDDDSKQLSIGTRIAKGHRHYTLMYDMLTGIRIAVGRVSAKLWRDLSDQDFRAAHKLVFDVTGNELTPGVKYDFKFKDYAPWVFRHLRERFRIDPADYMMSLTNKYILSELSSPGKSKSFFYYSRDCRFIIKTIHHVEHRFLRRILKQYYNHVCENPNTLLSRFYGLHRIKLPRGRKIHFIVMGNVFPASKDLHLVFDLKGSTFGRFTPEERLATNPMTVLKDQNWTARSQKLQLGPEKKNVLIQQLERDIALLTSMNIMDYSMLVGIHDMERENTDDPEDQHLHIVRTEHMGSADSTRRASKATFVRNALKNTNSRLLDKKELPKRLSMERKHCVFYADDGGFQATNADNQSESLLYFIGIIDILTPYNKRKKTEHFWKSITQDKHTISSVPAGEYGERFMHFMKHAVTR
ncbi:SAICAR synthase-like protein [Lichtheimia hyalospora FSU 10163]|nr:SAICAR synthase-like protein [Lichtheimia hyalospora FSU 10163]